MPEIVEHHERAVRDVAVETMGGGRRDQAVTAAPYNECRLRHLGDPMSLRGVLSLLFPLPPTLDERVTIALAFGDLPGADDHLICDPARVAEDVTQTLLDEAARKRVPHHPVMHGQASKIKREGLRYRGHGVALRINQNEILHKGRMLHGRTPGDTAAERITAHDAPFDAQMVQHGNDQPHVFIEAVSPVGRWAGKSESPEVEANDAPSVF